MALLSPLASLNVVTVFLALMVPAPPLAFSQSLSATLQPMLSACFALACGQLAYQTANTARVEITYLIASFYYAYLLAKLEVRYAYPLWRQSRASISSLLARSLLSW